MDLLDPYVRPARLAPMTLVLAPIVLVAVLLVPTIAPISAKVAPLVVALGLPLLVSQLVQDRGNAVQDRLWRRWGGAPTTQLLRYLDNPEPQHRDRRRGDLQRITEGRVVLPTEEDERDDPAAAAAAYADAVALLRGRTRRRDEYPTVFAENVSYGYRRNCLALRLLGITVATAVALGCLTVALVTGLGPAHTDGGQSAAWAAAAGGAALVAVLWWRAVSATWVRIAAFRYARAVLDAAAGM